jgi:hypothetical protein
MSQETDGSEGESEEGTIEPEVAEKLASAFVPMWQLVEEEGPRWTDMLPPPFDPFPQGAEMSSLALSEFEADPFPSPRDDGASENLGVPIGVQLTSDPVLRSPSLEPSMLESQDVSSYLSGGREALASRRLFAVFAGATAIFATLALPCSRGDIPMQPPVQAVFVKAPTLPESPSIPPPPPVSEPLVTSGEEPPALSAPAPKSTTSARDLHAHAPLQRRASSTELPHRSAGESASPPRSSELPHEAAAGTSSLGSDRLPKKASGEMDGPDAAIGACTGLDVSCVKCRSPGTCQQLPGQCTGGVCSNASQPDGSSSASGKGSDCDACAGGSCMGTLCIDGGT